jgi:hypothetical protein
LKDSKSKLEKEIIKPENIFDKLKDMSINSMVSAMINAVELYQDEIIQADDLFTVERLIDRYPFNNTPIKNREEFEKIYCRFKEYNLRLFLEDKKESKYNNL